MKNDTIETLAHYIAVKEYFRLYNIEQDSCNCGMFYKFAFCKHQICIKLIYGKITVPDKYEDLNDIFKKMNVGRPPKISSALNF